MTTDRLKTQTFGVFMEDEGQRCEYLKMRFSPTSIPIQQRWRNNGLSADFLADYLSTFFPGQDPAASERQVEIKGAVSYLANELLENAMKFSYAPSEHAITLDMYLKVDGISLYVTNSIAPDAVQGFQQLIERLLSEDPEALYMAQLERNADTDPAQGSGLGLLTMLHDYQATLAWKFTPLAHDADVTIVTTMAHLLV